MGNTIATTATPLLAIHVKGKPISVNRMYRQSRWGGKYLAPEAQAWQGAVWTAAYEKRMGIPKGTARATFPPGATYRVVCTFFHIRGNADADNLLKLTLDGLKTGLHVDDRYFTTVEAHKSTDRLQPQGALIEVYTATPEQGAA